MLLQRAGTGTIPPSGFIPPAWDILAASWDAAPLPASRTVTLGPATVTLGHDDSEDADEEENGEEEDVNEHEFGWDNEHPSREVHVGAFRIEWRPVTNGEFWTFWQEQRQAVPTKKDDDGKGLTFPASWVEVKDDAGRAHVQVRTLYGPVPMKTAWHWPVMTSCDNLSVYAKVKEIGRAHV